MILENKKRNIQNRQLIGDERQKQNPPRNKQRNKEKELSIIRLSVDNIHHKETFNLRLELQSPDKAISTQISTVVISRTIRT